MTIILNSDKAVLKQYIKDQLQDENNELLGNGYLTAYSLNYCELPIIESMIECLNYIDINFFNRHFNNTLTTHQIEDHVFNIDADVTCEWLEISIDGVNVTLGHDVLSTNAVAYNYDDELTAEEIEHLLNEHVNGVLTASTLIVKHYHDTIDALLALKP